MSINTYCIVDNGTEKAQAVRAILNKMLINWEVDLNHPQYVFVLGGDGTFIKNAVKFNKPNVKLILINAGSFGFFSSFHSADDLQSLLKEISLPTNYKKMNLLRVEWAGNTLLAVNDIVLHSFVANKINVYINDELLGKYWNSGFVFSTPAGSTGINKSFSGSIVSPLVNCYEFIQLAPVSHAEFYTLENPIILPTNAVMQIKDAPKLFEYTVTVDGVNHHDLFKSGEITISCVVSKASFFFDWELTKYTKKLHRLYMKGE